MGAFAAGQVVVVHFPFSDLTASKLRPAVVLAEAGRGDWVLCQITSKSYGDARAIQLDAADFAQGPLPGKPAKSTPKVPYPLRIPSGTNPGLLGGLRQGHARSFPYHLAHHGAPAQAVTQLGAAPHFYGVALRFAPPPSQGQNRTPPRLLAKTPATPLGG
jgi:hypothetical protein